MHPRLELDKVAPEALKAVLQVSAYIHNHSGLEPTLLNLYSTGFPNQRLRVVHRHAHERCSCFGRNRAAIVRGQCVVGRSVL